MPASVKAALALPQDELGAPEGGPPGGAGTSGGPRLVIETPQVRSAFMSLIASMLPASELRTLTTIEFDTLVATLAGEVSSNPQIHTILKGVAQESLSEIKSTGHTP